MSQSQSQSQSQRSAQERRTPRPGERVGPWLLEAVLGEGGLGQIYRARGADGAVVALKVLRPEADQVDPATRARFQNEGQVLLGLRHPNLIAVLDRGRDDERGVGWLAMELVAGQDLDQLLARVPRLSPGLALHVIDGCAQALAAAHAQGILHRDVKASNVLLTGAGEVKLADFGLALAAGQSRITGRDELPGTLPYTAPEVLFDARWSPASDAYALGVLAHRLLAGAYPFPQREPMRLIEAHLTALPPDLCELVPGLPEPVGALVAALLAKEPERRPTCAQLPARLRATGCLMERSQVAAAIGALLEEAQRDA